MRIPLLSKEKSKFCMVVSEIGEKVPLNTKKVKRRLLKKIEIRVEKYEEWLVFLVVIGCVKFLTGK